MPSSPKTHTYHRKPTVHFLLHAIHHPTPAVRISEPPQTVIPPRKLSLPLDCHPEFISGSFERT